MTKVSYQLKQMFLFYLLAIAFLPLKYISFLPPFLILRYCILRLLIPNLSILLLDFLHSRISVPYSIFSLYLYFHY